MDFRDLINKEKLRCDNLISFALIGCFGFMFFFFRLIIFMSLIVYPISSLFLYGLYKIYHGFTRSKISLLNKILEFVLGVIYVIFSIFILSLIFSYISSTSYIIIFLVIPSIFIGVAAILKGLLVHVYSSFYRNMNILVGIITLINSIFCLTIAEDYFLISLISLGGFLGLNGIFRSGLYLSEYGLSLWKVKNLRVVIYIMDNLQLINPVEENID